MCAMTGVQCRVSSISLDKPNERWSCTRHSRAGLPSTVACSHIRKLSLSSRTLHSRIHFRGKITARQNFGIRCSQNAGDGPPLTRSSADRLLQRGKLLSQICSWGIGGPAQYFAEVHNEDELRAVLRFASERDLEVLPVGRGSNCLFHDRGFAGVVISNRIRFNQRLERRGDEGSADLYLMPEENEAQERSIGEVAFFRVGAGLSFDSFGRRMASQGWGGLEFASGIPGTVGGAVFMNAGANGQETAQVVHAVETVSCSGQRQTFSRAGGDLPFRYRWSPFQEMGSPGKRPIITAVTFELTYRGSQAAAAVADFTQRRMQTQPVGEQSAGCVFRNPAAVVGAPEAGGGEAPEVRPPSAGQLIEQAGLKGYAVGGASVSHKHANFLVNTTTPSQEGGGARGVERGVREQRRGGPPGGAKRGLGLSTSAEMVRLIEHVKRCIKEETGYDLHEEISRVPYTWRD